MNLNNCKVLIAAQYAAPYMGNFIKSLMRLENVLADRFNATCRYVFPDTAKKHDWIAQFEQSHNLSFTSDNHLTSDCTDIVNSYSPDLIYTHFEGYDVPMYKAAVEIGKDVKMVWHMHDYLSYQKNPLKALYQALCFFKHYGQPVLVNSWGGVSTSFIAVCKHELSFIKRYRLFKKVNETVIPNGVDFDRLSHEIKYATKSNELYAFLAFGGRNPQKRVDLLIEAGKILDTKELPFKIIITKGTDTEAVVASIFGNNRPNWLELIEQSDDVSKIYSMADCFVSSSSCETFSYAVAEATLMNKPVIQSDIEGTRWNENNPSVEVFKSGNVINLADRMQEMILSDKAQMHKDCEITRQNNLQFLSLDRWSNDVINHFISI